MYIEQGGEGADLLVMLHGMGATAAVWSPMCAQAGERWRGHWLVVDLPGHGGSDPQETYPVGQYAASVARAMLPHVDELRPIHNLESMRELVQALSGGAAKGYDPKEMLRKAA